MNGLPDADDVCLESVVIASFEVVDAAPKVLTVDESNAGNLLCFFSNQPLQQLSNQKDLS